MNDELELRGRAKIRELTRSTGKDITQLMIEAAELSQPALFKKFYPRIYSELGSYYSPKIIAAFLVDAVVHARDLEFLQLPQAYRMILPGLELISRKKMPYMFIAPRLVEAIKRTDFPHEIDWQDMHLPYEQGIFMLPKGALMHPTDGDVACIYYSRLKPGTVYPRPDPYVIEFKTIGGNFSIAALCPKTVMWYDSNLTDEGRPVLKLNNLFYAYGDAYAGGPQLGEPSELDSPLTHEDSVFLEHVAVVLFGTFLAMNARPGLITPAALQKVVQKKGEAKKEFWSPNIIGRDYRPPQPKVIAGGTHASPRMHWRRGHFRNHAVGTGRLERRTIWLEPTLVGAGEEK